MTFAQFAPQIVAFLLTLIAALILAGFKHVAAIAGCVRRIEIVLENLSTRVTFIESNPAHSKRAPRTT